MFPLGNLFANVFESCQSFYHLHAEVTSNFCTQFTGDYGLYHSGCRGQCLFSGGQYEMGQKSAHLVSRNENKVISLSHSGPDTVTIWVSAEYNISPHLFSQLNAHGQCFFIFWIGGSDGREIAIRLFLFFHHMYIGESRFLQNLLHRFASTTMDWRIHDGQFRWIPLVKRLLENGIHKEVHHILVQHGQKSFIFFRINGRQIGNSFYIGSQHIRILRHQLGPIGSIHFIAVIFRWIVAGSDHHAAQGMEMFHRKRKHRNRFQFLKQFHRDTRTGQHIGSHTSKLLGMIARIIGNDHSL